MLAQRVLAHDQFELSGCRRCSPSRDVVQRLAYTHFCDPNCKHTQTPSTNRRVRLLKKVPIKKRHRDEAWRQKSSHRQFQVSSLEARALRTFLTPLLLFFRKENNGHSWKRGISEILYLNYDHSRDTLKLVIN